MSNPKDRHVGGENGPDRMTDAELRKLKNTHSRASLYWSNRDVILRNFSEMKIERKVAGICRRCPTPCLEDHGMCARCRRKENASARVRMRKLRRRRRAAERREVASYVPIDEVVSLPRVRILRAARRLEWFTTDELNKDLGVIDAVPRNTNTKMIGRLVTLGRLQRRIIEARHLDRGNGSQFEYQIATAGITEIDAILGGRLKPSRAGRRAA
jgi:hypothetical protein